MPRVKDRVRATVFLLLLCGFSSLAPARTGGAAPRAGTGDAEAAGAVPLASKAPDLTLHGQRAYVVSSHPWWGWSPIGQLVVLDLTDPDSPRRESAIDLIPFDIPRAIACQGSRVYVAGARIHVLDVSDPAAPESQGVLALPSGATRLAVSGGHAYAACGNDVHIVDVSDPRAPALLGSIAMPERIRDLVLLGDHLAVSLDTIGIEIVDVRESRAPARVARVRSIPRARGMAARGQRLYVASEAAGLVILDVSHPDRPAVMGSAMVPGARKVTLQGSNAMLESVIWPTTRLHVVDVSNPRSPVVGAEIPLAPGTDTIDFGAMRWVARMKSCRDDCIGGGDCCDYWIESGRTGAGEPSEGTAGTAEQGRGSGSRPSESGAAAPATRSDPDASLASGRIEEVRGAGPFGADGVTSIAFTIAGPTRAKLSIYDASGRAVAVLVDETLPPGRHVARWDGRDRTGRFAPSGVYFLRLDAGPAMESRTLVRCR